MIINDDTLDHLLEELLEAKIRRLKALTILKEMADEVRCGIRKKKINNIYDNN